MPPKLDTKLSHFNADGKAFMVDIGDKDITHRTARARGQIDMLPKTLAKIKAGNHQKGDVLTIARIAAIMAAKKTAELIPLCHPIMLTKVEVDFTLDEANNAVICEVSTQTHERTGIEMEALCALNVGLLTIYDMCKAVDRGMKITGIRLTQKTGGKSGDWEREGSPT